MALLFESARPRLWWKITYDETYAAASPGVLLVLDMTEFLLARSAIALTDSCAQATTSRCIDHIWSERMALADLFVAVDAGRIKKFASLARREALYRSLRQKLKTAVNKLRRGVQAASANFSLVFSKAKSSQGVSASMSEVSTVGPHQIRKPGGASRCAPTS